MNESLQEIASLYVLDQLDATARVEFEARLLREPELAAFVRELETGLTRGVRSLPPVEPPAPLFARIEDQVKAQGWSPTSGRAGSATAVPASGQPARRSGSTITWVNFAKWGLAAMIAVSLATLAIQSVRRPAEPVFVIVGLDANRNTFTELPQAGTDKDPDARFIQLASLADNYRRNPTARPGQPKPIAGDSRGYALFDPASRQGFIAIEQIPALAENQRYHLWVADAKTGQVRDAGTLPLAGLNRGLYSFALDPSDPAKSDRPLLFITAEDSGDATPPEQPRGKVVLGQRSF